MKKSELLELVGAAAAGEIRTPSRSLVLTSDKPLEYESEIFHRERWFYQLHLRAEATRRPAPDVSQLSRVDNALRNSIPPFDGLQDVSAWLGLHAPNGTSISPCIQIRVSPPVDLVFDKCELGENQLNLHLDAHPNFDVARVGLAVSAVPGKLLEGRQQIAQRVDWGEVQGDRRSGVVRVALPEADNALAILLIEDSIVRRQWFLDPKKPANTRLAAVQHFDSELRKVRNAVRKGNSSITVPSGIHSGRSLGK